MGMPATGKPSDMRVISPCRARVRMGTRRHTYARAPVDMALVTGFLRITNGILLVVAVAILGAGGYIISDASSHHEDLPEVPELVEWAGKTIKDANLEFITEVICLHVAQLPLQMFLPRMQLTNLLFQLCELRLDVGRLLPAALGDGPHRPRVLDLVRRLRVRLDLQPPASLAKLLLLADVPRGRAVGGEAEPEHVVGVVVLLICRPAMQRAAGSRVFSELVLRARAGNDATHT